MIEYKKHVVNYYYSCINWAICSPWISFFYFSLIPFLLAVPTMPIELSALLFRLLLDLLLSHPQWSQGSRPHKQVVYKDTENLWVIICANNLNRYFYIYYHIYSFYQNRCSCLCLLRTWEFPQETAYQLCNASLLALHCQPQFRDEKFEAQSCLVLCPGGKS